MLKRCRGHASSKWISAVDEIRAATKQLTESVGKINRSILAEENLRELRPDLEKPRRRFRHLEGPASGKLEPTIADAREAIRDIRAAAVSAEKTLENANQPITGLQPALKDVPAAVNNISRTAKKAGDAIDRIEQGDGLLGTVATDAEVSTDAKVFMSNLRRYGILRYSNAETAPEDDPRERFRGKRR